MLTTPAPQMSRTQLTYAALLLPGAARSYRLPAYFHCVFTLQ